jgi:hypothetical protein
MDDLRSERPKDLGQKFESNFTPTTLPILPYIEIEQLHDTRNQLIEKRRELFNSWFLFLRPGKNKQIEIIDEQLDQIEHQIISLQKDDREVVTE